jgi:Zn finger protein HypA/HybF involved in hydrogenase expression
MVPKKSTKTYKVKRFDKRYISTVSKKYQRCPDEWMKLVTKKTYVYKGATGFGWGGYGDWRNWDTSRFDPNIWKDRKTVAPQARPPLIPPATKPITFPPHDQKTSGPLEEVLDADFNPCQACPFSQHKIDWVLEQLTEINSDDDIPTHYDEKGNPIDWYECDQCKQVFSTPEDQAVCPNCQVDDHLVLLDDEDLKDMVVKDGSNGETDNDWYIDWYRCNTCNHIFNTTSSSPECEKCKTNDNLVILQLDGDPTPYLPEDATSYNYKCKECGTETSILNHGQCPFCGGDVLSIIDEEDLKAAKEEDKNMESLPIPIPDQEKIPLASGKTQTRKPGIFATLFKKGK